MSWAHKGEENQVSVRDFHSSLLHPLGLDFRDLVYERNGLKDRITDQIPAALCRKCLPERITR
jgi:hypothetical protein